MSDYDLGALYVPVIPETSKVGPEMEKAGRAAREAFNKGTKGIGDELGKGILDGIQGANLPGHLDSLISAMSSKTGAMAGLVGGAVSAGLNAVSNVMSAMLELVAKGFETVIDLGEKLARKVVDVGEEWERFGQSIATSTTATGDALGRLNSSLDRIASSGAPVNLGYIAKNIGGINGALGLVGAPLDKLLTDLGLLDTMGMSVDANNLTRMLRAWHVSGVDADQVLNQLFNTARETNIPINELIEAARKADPAFHQMGWTIGQTAAFLAQVNLDGVDTNKVMMGIGAAMRYAAKEGIPLNEVLPQAIAHIRELQEQGRYGDANAYAMAVFGPGARGGGLQMLELIRDNNLEIRNGTVYIDGMAISAVTAGDSIADTAQRTETLGQKLLGLKNQASEALKPFGTMAVEGLTAAFEKLGQWIEGHKSQIFEFIKGVGDKFIDALPIIKQFASDTLRLLGPALDLMVLGLKAVGQILGPIVAGFGLLSGQTGIAKIGVEITKAANTSTQSFTDLGKKWADTIDKMVLDTEQWKTSWDAAINEMNQSKVYGPVIGPNQPGWMPPTDLGYLMGAPGQPTQGPVYGPTIPGTLNTSAGPIAPSSASLPFGGAKGEQIGTTSVRATLQSHLGKAISGGYRQPDNFDEHSGGNAFDVMVGSKAEGDRVAADALRQPGVDYVIWWQRTWRPDGSSDAMGDRGSPTQNHMDHVHVHVRSSGYAPGNAPSQTGLPRGANAAPLPNMAAGSPGQGFPLPWNLGPPPPPPSPGGQSYKDLYPQSFQVDAQGNVITGGQTAVPDYSQDQGTPDKGGVTGTPAYTPYVEGQGYTRLPYPGLSAAGGVTEDQWNTRQKAIELATDAANDANYRVKEAQDRLARLQAEVDDTGKRKATDEEIGKATHDLAVARREAGERTADLTEAERRAGETKPEKLGKSAKGGEAGSIGQGLLKGLLSDLGFDDQLFSDPTEWGIFKLAVGATNYAGGLLRNVGKYPTGMFGPGGPMEGQSWGDQQAATGGTLPFGAIPGLNISAAATPTPNAMGPAELSQFPINQAAPGQGPPQGPLPGPQQPGIGGPAVVFNGPVTTQNPQELVPHMKEYQNSNTRYTQSKPAPGPG